MGSDEYRREIAVELAFDTVMKGDRLLTVQLVEWSGLLPIRKCGMPSPEQGVDARPDGGRIPKWIFGDTDHSTSIREPIMIP